MFYVWLASRSHVSHVSNLIFSYISLALWNSRKPDSYMFFKTVTQHYATHIPPAASSSSLPQIYFMFCSAFTVTTAATLSLVFSQPSIVPSYRPVYSILQCPDVLLSLRISLHSAFSLLSYLRSISLLGASFLCRLLWPIWPVCPLSLTYVCLAEVKKCLKALNLAELVQRTYYWYLWLVLTRIPQVMRT